MGDEETDVRARARVCIVLKGEFPLGGGIADAGATTHLRSSVPVKLLHRDLPMDAGLRGRFLRDGP
jgi:hypothetical protein